MAKSYLPSSLINSSYRYTIANDSIVVHTNNNCYNNYSTTYCDCIQVYPKMDYLESETYSCNYNPSSFVSSSRFTNDIWYRIDLSDTLLIFLILFLFIFLFPYKLVSRLFGRWLKI